MQLTSPLSADRQRTGVGAAQPTAVRVMVRWRACAGAWGGVWLLGPNIQPCRRNRQRCNGGRVGSVATYGAASM